MTYKISPLTAKCVFLGLSLAGTAPAFSDEAEVLDIQTRATGGTLTFAVTILHADTGWEDYADGWEILDENGTRLGFRELLHPHVNEQPFTRSLSGVVVPEGTGQVFVRTRTNTDGWGETLTVFDLR